MHQLVQGLVQLATWCGSSPAAMQITLSLLLGAKRGYRQLSPAAKAAVDSIMIQAAEYLAKATLGDVVGWSKSQAISMGLSSDAVSVVEIGVRRVGEVGIDKAFEEIRG